MKNKVVVIKADASDIKYPPFPFLPNKIYPEFNGYYSQADDINDNIVYDAIRQLFFYLDLDKENFGSKNWNPLGKFLKEGNTVLIKPNWVRDFNPINKKSIDSLITHTSIIRTVIDYVLKGINYKGKIIIGDAPLQNCDFTNLISKNRINALLSEYSKRYKNVEFIIEDWRLTIFDRIKGAQKISTQTGGYRIIDLGKESFLEEISDYSELFRVTCYNYNLMHEHHKKGKHEYLITNRVFEADFIINLPKLKTHIKAGLTGALKNLIGINGHKEFLPHHIKGAYLDGGDNYINPSFWKKLYEDFDDKVWSSLRGNYTLLNKFNFQILKLLHWCWYLFSKDKVFAGGWSGNETIWRTILDLNHIMYFYNTKTNTLDSFPQRNVLTIVDGIIAGQGEGPLLPLDKKLGIVIGGFNPALIDAVIARIIGFNISRIPTVYNALYNIKSRFCLKSSDKDVIIEWVEKNNHTCYDIDQIDTITSYNFIPPRYWKRALSRR